jgi:hypothetical protein
MDVVTHSLSGSRVSRTSRLATLQNVVPSYYAMSKFVELNALDRPEIKILEGTNPFGT